MNRRIFFSLVPAVAVLPVLGRFSAHVPPLLLVQRKRLAPDAHAVSFSASGDNLLTGPFQLRSKGNGLWVQTVVWVDEAGDRHRQIVAKNLSPGQGMPLPMIAGARQITFEVTCLPLVTTTTVVELVG